VEDRIVSIVVRFTPTALGIRNGDLSISAPFGGSAVYRIQGTGIPPLTIAPTSPTFAPVKIGLPGQSQVITVRNISAIASGVITATASSPAFRITANTCTGTNLAANATCNVTIQWLPTVVGTITGSFTVAGSPNFSVSATLTGTGTP
jgi:hypothetical protein